MTKALQSPKKAKIMHRKKQFGKVASKSLTDDLTEKQLIKLRSAVVWAQKEARAVRSEEAQIESMLRETPDGKGPPTGARQQKALVKQLVILLTPLTLLALLTVLIQLTY